MVWLQKSNVWVLVKSRTSLYRHLSLFLIHYYFRRTTWILYKLLCNHRYILRWFNRNLNKAKYINEGFRISSLISLITCVFWINRFRNSNEIRFIIYFFHVSNFLFFNRNGHLYSLIFLYWYLKVYMSFSLEKII